ncbi:MAG TPA: hypothetical protein VFK20_00980 [Vicinamibacterales bacterium]|nr:hypothetical protein [Vicinamibacterales bacterium]
MDGTLVSVTLLSMAMAISLSVVVWRLLRDERRRSSARVAALVELAARNGRPTVARAPVRPHVPTAIAPPADLPLRRSDTPVKVADLFTAPAEPSPWPRRGAVIAALVLVAAAAVLLLLTRASASRSGPAVTSAPATRLELLSLRDARQGDDLTITGLVQNPRGSRPLSNISAVATTYDAGGAALASGSAPLDFTTLQGGDESPFVITVPAAGAVARYRISFRGSDGRVIAHVDRRQPPMARGTW